MPPLLTPAAESRWPHRWAVLLVCATFPLIWVGGLVTTYQAGMAVPDWPNTYGYNLFLYPWQTWLAGPWDLFIEHGHRLLGALVGLLTIALAVSLQLTERRGWVRALGWGAVLGVIAQGVLGGLRVRMDAQQLAKIHGCTGPAFLVLAVLLATCTARGWHNAQPVAVPRGPRLQRLALSTALLTFGQLVLGAQVRHVPSGMNFRTFQLLMVFHLIMAAVLAYHIAVLAWAMIGLRHLSAGLAWRGAFLAAVLLVQVLLGSLTWVVNYGWPQWLHGYHWSEAYVVQAESFWQSVTTTAHVACGSLVLALGSHVALFAHRWVAGGAAVPTQNSLWAGAAV